MDTNKLRSLTKTMHGLGTISDTMHEVADEIDRLRLQLRLNENLLAVKAAESYVTISEITFLNFCQSHSEGISYIKTYHEVVNSLNDNIVYFSIDKNQENFIIKFKDHSDLIYFDGELAAMARLTG